MQHTRTYTQTYISANKCTRTHTLYTHTCTHTLSLALSHAQPRTHTPRKTNPPTHTHAHTHNTHTSHTYTHEHTFTYTYHTQNSYIQGGRIWKVQLKSKTHGSTHILCHPCPHHPPHFLSSPSTANRRIVAMAHMCHATLYRLDLTHLHAWHDWCKSWWLWKKFLTRHTTAFTTNSHGLFVVVGPMIENKLIGTSKTWWLWHLMNTRVRATQQANRDCNKWENCERWIKRCRWLSRPSHSVTVVIRLYPCIQKTR